MFRRHGGNEGREPTCGYERACDRAGGDRVADILSAVVDLTNLGCLAVKHAYRGFAIAETR